jgi:hypothetical protein
LKADSTCHSGGNGKSESKRRKGKDGKIYPAKKQKKQYESDAEPESEPEMDTEIETQNSVLGELQHWWQKADTATRANFLAWIQCRLWESLY